MSARLRSNRRVATLVGMATLVGFATLTSGCGVSLQSLPKVGGLTGPSYEVHAEFANVLNLPADAQVRIGAEVVGEVSSITTRDFAADLVLRIKDGIRIPQATTAEVRFDNPLGDEYVLLQLPSVTSGPVLVNGSSIPRAATSTAPSVEDTLGALSLVLTGGGIGQLQTVIHELNNTFTGNQPRIRSLLGEIDTSVSSLARGHAAVDDALTAIEGLSGRLDRGRSTITGGLDAITPAIDVLGAEHRDISSLLDSFATFSTTAQQIASASDSDIRSDIGALLPVVDQLQSIGAQLGPDLQTLSKFEAVTPKIAPGDYLQASVVANVILPSGAVDATPGSTGAATVAPTSNADTAIDDLLGAGLL